MDIISVIFQYFLCFLCLKLIEQLTGNWEREWRESNPYKMDIKYKISVI